MAGQLENRVALITGGGSGFGRAAALQFCGEGARVAIGDLNAATAQETAQAVRAAGGEAFAAQVDVADERSVRRFFDAALEQFGRIDCAFNNAGILGPLGDLHSVSLADYERVMAVNVRGVWLCMQAELARMSSRMRRRAGTRSSTRRRSPAWSAARCCPRTAPRNMPWWGSRALRRAATGGAASG